MLTSDLGIFSVLEMLFWNDLYLLKFQIRKNKHGFLSANNFEALLRTIAQIKKYWQASKKYFGYPKNAP